MLVLGGTAESRGLALALERDPAIEVISSLAGRTAAPLALPGRTRVGGFGGVGGLAHWLGEHRVDLLVDATHPFAATMTATAAAAARQTGVPLLRLSRPEWRSCAHDQWHEVVSLAEAAEVLPQLGIRVFLTTGRQGVGAFAQLDELWFLVRCIETPAPPMPQAMLLLLERGPFDAGSELALMHQHRVQVLVTKNSGGAATAAKLAAARELRLPVVMVRRPSAPAGVTTVDSVALAVRWVAAQPG